MRDVGEGGREGECAFAGPPWKDLLRRLGANRWRLGDIPATVVSRVGLTYLS